MKNSYFSIETTKHLVNVANQINETNSFEHFIKMVISKLNPILLQETLINKYGVNPISLDYLYRGSHDDCLESSLLIAIKCKELKQ